MPESVPDNAAAAALEACSVLEDTAAAAVHRVPVALQVGLASAAAAWKVSEGASAGPVDRVGAAVAVPCRPGSPGAGQALQAQAALALPDIGMHC